MPGMTEKLLYSLQQHLQEAENLPVRIVAQPEQRVLQNFLFKVL